MTDLLTDLVVDRVRTLAFVRSRRGAETVALTAKRLLNEVDPTLTELRVMREKAVLYFEPRIALERRDIRVSPDDLGTLLLQLEYRVRTTNTRHNMVYPLYLDQATHPVISG